MRVPRVSWSGPFRRRFRLNRKTPAHLASLLIHSRPRVWKRLRQDDFSGSSLLDHTWRRCDHAYGGSVHEQDRIGVGKFPGCCAGPRLQVCTPLLSLV